ncbi:hypothetical protein ACHAXR_005501 [Thalassiosira sp. AJA248-18]
MPNLQENHSISKASACETKKWNTPSNHNLPLCSEYLFELSMDSKPWFLINSSRNFFSFLREEALKEGLTQIEIRNNQWGKGEYGIAIRGNRNARDGAVGQISHYLIDPPPQFFVQDSKTFSCRVVKLLSRKSKEILGKFSKLAFAEFNDDTVLICASNQNNTGKQIVFSIFEKLTFWVKQEGHDKFIDCNCCLDSFNLDQGVECGNGHFYCGGKDGCIGSMVKEQLGRIQHQANMVICSICQEPIETRSLAPFLSRKTWGDLEETMIDSKVKSRVQKLSHEFDNRLEARIAEFMSEYGSLGGMVKIEAKRLAKQAQDDILNLKCPHVGCRAPYAEFAGCMAIQCGSCKKHFCGYCHQGTDTGSGAHDHVRQCLVNETNNGSYYATPEQIKVAQRKHRTRELKKFLQPLKKDVQNATILELEVDLQYHNIEKAALFEFGNLHREIGQI